MSKLYTVKELKKMIQRASPRIVPRMTSSLPMARRTRAWKKKQPAASPQRLHRLPPKARCKIHNLVLPDAEHNWVPGGASKTAELEQFFYSPEIQALKERICHIGERIWNKGYVDGNGGNITVRVGTTSVLCTPTLISKGFGPG